MARPSKVKTIAQEQEVRLREYLMQMPPADALMIAAGAIVGTRGPEALQALSGGLGVLSSQQASALPSNWWNAAGAWKIGSPAYMIFDYFTRSNGVDTSNSDTYEMKDRVTGAALGMIIAYAVTRPGFLPALMQSANPVSALL